MLFIPDPALRKLAGRVVKAYPEHFDHIDLDRVEFCMEVNGKPSGANAICQKISVLVGDVIASRSKPLDFIIAFFSEAVEGKSDEWLTILMFHELLHIDPTGALVEHDIEDFMSVLDMVGHHWQNDKNLPDIIRKKIRLAG
jgi:predicted metallopeptidase